MLLMMMEAKMPQDLMLIVIIIVMLKTLYMQGEFKGDEVIYISNQFPTDILHELIIGCVGKNV